MSNTIIFYDIPSTLPGSAWSPNTWKTRYCLNYKGLPYKTEWVEYPDIEPLCRRLGVAPTSTKHDGSPRYTLPTIYDPSTDSAISDSLLIAEYLDKTYPDTPKLFPNQSNALQFAFADAHFSTIAALWPFTVPRSYTHLNSHSVAYFGQIVRGNFGVAVEGLLPVGEAREPKWALVKQAFGQLDAWFAKAPRAGPFVMGDIISFADFIVAGYLAYAKRVLGEESLEWKDMKTWHGGRWEALLKNLEQYEHVI